MKSESVKFKGRVYERYEDGTIRKIAPSPIMDGAEADAVAEVFRLRRIVREFRDRSRFFR